MVLSDSQELPELRIARADALLVFGSELAEADWFVLGAGAFLVQDVHQAPFALEDLGFVGGQVVSCEVDDHGWALGLPVLQQGEAKFLVHEPADFEFFF